MKIMLIILILVDGEIGIIKILMRKLDMVLATLRNLVVGEPKLKMLLEI